MSVYELYCPRPSPSHHSESHLYQSFSHAYLTYNAQLPGTPTQACAVCQHPWIVHVIADVRAFPDFLHHWLRGGTGDGRCAGFWNVSSCFIQVCAPADPNNVRSQAYRGMSRLNVSVGQNGVTTSHGRLCRMLTQFSVHAMG